MKKVCIALLLFVYSETLHACFKLKKKKVATYTLLDDNKLQIGTKNVIILDEKGALFYLTQQQEKTFLHELIRNNRNVLAMRNDNNQTPIEIAITQGYTDSLAVFVEYLGTSEKQNVLAWAKKHTKGRNDILALLEISPE